MKMFDQRIEIMNISHYKNAWPRTLYKNDAFYQYALSNQSLPIGMMHEHYFAYTCYHKMTGEFVGYIQGYLPSLKKSVWIQTFLIDRKYLRQGYGREFYELILKAFNDYFPINKVYLACFEENTQGNIFWEKLLFKKILEKNRFSLSHHINSKIYIYERELLLGLQKEFIYEQENIKNIGIQQNY